MMTLDLYPSAYDAFIIEYILTRGNNIRRSRPVQITYIALARNKGLVYVHNEFIIRSAQYTACKKEIGMPMIANPETNKDTKTENLETKDGQAQDPQSPQPSPLTVLAGTFKADIKQVNALIIEHMDSDVPLIPELAQYLIMAGGKRIRPLLTIAGTRLCGDDSARPWALAAAVEFIHTATLLHDDVVDDSEERRGQDAAPLVFGNQATVLVGDFLFSRAFQLMVSDKDLDVLRILSHASAVIAEGEVMQLQTAKNIKTTLDDYKKVIGAKTAALFAAACEIGPVIAGAGNKTQDSFRAYGYNLGMAFQIADDILDYNAEHQALGKALGDDFREGKLTAPVLLALQDATDKEARFWQRTMGDLEQNEDDLQTALDILSRHKALERSHDMAQTYAAKADKALSEIETIAEDPLKTALVDLAYYAASRSY